MKIFVVAVFLCCILEARCSVFDNDLYQSVIDDDQCRKQLEYLSEHMDLQFLDASSKPPNGIFAGNVNDLGNYHLCLGISEEREDMNFEGKYCSVTFPITSASIETQQAHQLYSILYRRSSGKGESDSGITERNIVELGYLGGLALTMAVCIPKVCRTHVALDYFQQHLMFVNFTYQENYCRLPNDKLFHVADYVAVVIFGILIVFVIISTTYDLFYIYKQDAKSASTLYKCFSVYTNMRRLCTFSKSPGCLDCMDGIRAISMLWVICAHTYISSTLYYISNVIYMIDWSQSIWNLWVYTAPTVCVDSFFLSSGILVVYTVLGKFKTGLTLISNLHFYLLNRMFRMFPLLAAVVLLQASLFNHLLDGPNWNVVASLVETCRTNWWSALLHVQNYNNPEAICVGPSWYISVDMQLYFIAPFVLIFLFGRKRVGLTASLAFAAISIIICTTYSFINNFPPKSPLLESEVKNKYFNAYYVNTVTRSPTFFIGMCYGYLLFIWRHRTTRIQRPPVVLLWLVSLAMMAFAFYSTYPVSKLDHDNQLMDNLFNSFIRPIWAVGLGWLIFACVHGYGGPINWFLSLDLWKLPARLSYAMFLLHFPLQVVVNGSWTSTKYFSNPDAIYRAFSDVVMTTFAAIALTLLVDSPFSTLQKRYLSGTDMTISKTPEQEQRNPSTIKIDV